MEHLVNPANQAETVAVLARLLDNPRGVQDLAGALRQLAAALEAVAIAARPTPRLNRAGWHQP